MNHPRFSVITVCFNPGQALLETVNRTLAQTCTDFEILVKDACSTDGSVEQLPEDPRIRLIRGKDQGIYDAMNVAIREARGDYLIFMNCGDWFHDENALQAVWDAVEQTHGELYYGRIYNRREHHVTDYPRQITRMTCYRTMICHQAMVFSAPLLKARGYDLSYRILADREQFLYLVCERHVQPIYVDAVIADYEGGGESSKPEHIQRNAADKRRMLDTYFPKGEQLRYRWAMALTFPRLRRAIAHSPRLGRLYYGLTGHLYARKKK